VRFSEIETWILLTREFLTAATRHRLWPTGSERLSKEEVWHSQNDSIRFDEGRPTYTAGQATIMHRATDDLRASGIMDLVIKVGYPLPPFAL